MKKSLLFRKIESIEPVVNYLTDVITQRLGRNDKVLWLVPGGSAVKVATAVSKKLDRGSLRNLTVTLTDERYGPVGHKDSNWPQLEVAGFELPGANLSPVLTGLSLEETADGYAKMIEKDLDQADFSVALAGMGSDGHIFGIKPKSPAINTPNLVVGYEWDDFVRITPTAEVINKLDEVVIYAVGKEKWPQLASLSKAFPPDEQPAQLLKRLKKVIIFNDYKDSSE